MERSLGRAGTKVLRTGRFPPGGREGVVLFPVNAAQAGARAAALFSGEEALEQKKVRRGARLFGRDRVFEFRPCTFFA